jgi:hypothetical protein
MSHPELRGSATAVEADGGDVYYRPARQEMLRSNALSHAEVLWSNSANRVLTTGGCSH